jgi:putative glutamine amidotransferase
MVLGLKYLKAIEHAGGIPFVVPPLHRAAIEPLLDSVAGVCLSGGPDLDPAAYGQPRHPQLGPTFKELDDFELALARAADARGVPILAICRGLQTFNVARGGTLYQHVPDVVGERITHRQTEPGTQATHSVTFSGPSRLAETLGVRRTRVNSFHHQAIDVLGQGLVVTGRAPDGTVESLEARDRAFAVAVQWHAESLTGRPRHARLFTAFVDAAGTYAEAGQTWRRAA